MCKQGLLLLFIIGLTMSCKVTKDFSDEMASDRQYVFPVEWIGKYKGQLNIIKANNDTMKVNMELYIDSPDAEGFYPWILKYGEKDVRYYGLEVVDAERGHYLIDEHNSIKLDAFLRGNHLITKFSVMDSDLIFHYEKNGKGIAIKVYTSSAESFSETGGEVIANDTIPTVASYKLAGFQSALLHKIN